MSKHGTGNAGHGNPTGQKIIESGKGGKMGGHDSMIKDKAKSVGSAKPAEKSFSDHCNVPVGQKIVG